MAASRVKSLKDECLYKQLIKMHLEDPSHTTRKWNHMDMDKLAENYQEFLCCIAQTGCKINVTIFTKCLRNHFESSPPMCKSFAQKMADVLSECRSKCKPGRVSSGSKTNRAVLAIMGAIGKDSVDEVPGSSEDECAVMLPGTPPRKEKHSEAANALRMLEEAFGADAASRTACSSRSELVPDSPISVASSIQGQSPQQCVVAKAAYTPDLPLKVPAYQITTLTQLQISTHGHDSCTMNKYSYIYVCIYMYMYVYIYELCT